MRLAYLAAPALVLTLTAGAFAADLEDLIPLWSAPRITYCLNDAKMKADLKITKEQDKAVQAVLKKFDKDTSGDGQTIFKFKGTQKEKFAQTRVLHGKRGEELLQLLGKVLDDEQVTRLKQLSLQHEGMGLFRYPEVREALKLSDKEADTLEATYKKLRDDCIRDFQSGKITKEEGRRRYEALGNQIPAGVRAQLSTKQRRALNDLLGEPFYGQ
jgi:hypothetical protein